MQRYLYPEINVVRERGAAESLLLGRSRGRGVVDYVYGRQEEDQRRGIGMDRCGGRGCCGYEVSVGGVEM